MRHARRHGFSLGEVFLAISLVVIAGGLTMANCQRGLRTARAASCASNVKQLAIALRSYCLDWDQPPRDPRDFAALQVYIKNTQICICPAQRVSREKRKVPLASSPPDTHVDYLFNPRLRLDEGPSLVLVGDDAPGRHLRGKWIGARLDGAVFIWPANEWESRLGGVIADVAPSP